MTPTGTPLDELAYAAAALTRTGAASIRRELADRPESFALIARQAAALPAGSEPISGQQLMVVVDQFEEVFTCCGSEAERLGFVAALNAAATVPAGPEQVPAACVVLVVRADFEASCLVFPELVNATQHRYLLPPMSEEQLRLVITEPARLAGSSVEPALVDQLAGQARPSTRPVLPAGLRVAASSGPEMLPLLSYALYQAWRNRTGETLTLADFDRIGGIRKSIATSAEAVYARLTEKQRDAARQIFVRLTITGADGGVSAARVTRAALVTGIGAGDADEVISAFSGSRARLITLGGAHDKPGKEWAEITHEVLLTAWDRLGRWLDGDLDDRVRYGRLTADAQTWDGGGRAASYLYSSGRLAEIDDAVRRWASVPERYPEFDAVTGDFLDAVRRSVRWSRWRRRAAVAVLAALTLFAFSAAGVALRYSGNADQQHAVALSRQLAAESLTLDPTDPIAARQLAVAAWAASPTPQAGNALVTLVTEQEHDGELPASGVDDPQDDMNDPDVSNVAFSPDGRLLASVDSYDYFRIWNTATDTLVTTPWPSSLTLGPGNLAFSPDDKLLADAATGEDTVNVQIWDATTGRSIERRTEADLSNGRSTLAFSPDGQQLAIATTNGVLIWNRVTQAFSRL
jgi:hypothetical protein